MIIEAGGFWLSDDRIIAMIGGYFLVFFLGLWIGESKKK
jgi:hypothetical protein